MGTRRKYLNNGTLHTILKRLLFLTDCTDLRHLAVFNMAKTTHCYVTAIFLMCFVICQVDAQQCKSEYSINGMMLKGRVLEKRKAATILSCAQHCDSNIRCQSVNYVISQYICELNSRTKDARPQDFIPDADRIYITRLFARGIVANQCT